MKRFLPLPVRHWLVFLLFAGCSMTAFGQEKPYVPGQFIVRFEPGTELSAVETSLENLWGANVHFSPLSRGSHIYRLDTDETVFDLADEGVGLLNDIEAQAGVVLVQFNHYLDERSILPNDPGIGNQWHHQQEDDHDIDSDEAWELTTGGTTAAGDDVVACVIELFGSNFNHDDLIDNHWTNPGEIPGNGLDDDDNGYVDDYHGWNPMESSDNIPGGNHGTGVSGMIGARGNNDNGGSGVNWDVKIMQVVLGELTEDQAIAAYDYPRVMRELYNSTGGDKGAFVVVTNSSFGIDFANPDNYPVWCGFYDDLGAVGILNCGATANQDIDVDELGDMPTGCTSPYMISVTATNANDQRTFSAYGANSIDLGAPGESVYLPSGSWAYGYTSGTSFASPAVAGAIALLYSAPCAGFADLALADPQLAADLALSYLYEGVDPVTNLSGETATGGRLNVASALNLLMDDCGPPPPCAFSSCTATPECALDTASGTVVPVVQLHTELNYTICSVTSVCWDSEFDSGCVTLEPDVYNLFNPDYTLEGLLEDTDYVLTVTTADGISTTVQVTTSSCSDLIPGCMDDAAINFNPEATFEDGSCEYPCSPITLNLTTDCWGSETSISLISAEGDTALMVPAWSLPSLTEFEWNLCLDDGCYTLNLLDQYGDGLAGTIWGCTQDGTFSFGYDAGVPIGQLDDPFFGVQASWTFCVVHGELPGCTDPSACNYVPLANTDDGSCYSIGEVCDDGNITTGNDTIQEDCTCSGYQLGCTDDTACNYSPFAELDDATCVYPGCTHPAADNYDPAAGCDDDSCTFSCELFPLEIWTDCWGEETAWELTDENGLLYYSSEGETYPDLTHLTFDLCLPNGCYELRVFDSYGDGMNGTSAGCEADGSYQLTNPAGSVLVSSDPGAAFGFAVVHAFCVNANCPADFDFDGQIIVPDLLILIGDYGCLTDCGLTDLTGDNHVDAQDLLEFLGVFGTDCE